MGCGPTKQESADSVLKPVSKESVNLSDKHVSGQLSKFCPPPGDTVKGDRGNQVLKVYCIDSKGKRVEEDQGIVTVMDNNYNLVAAWQSKGRDTFIYGPTPRVSRQEPSEVPVFEQAKSKVQLYSFAKADGGRYPSNQNFQVFMASGKDMYEDQGAYTGTGLGGNFFKVNKGKLDGPYVCTVGPARVHFEGGNEYTGLPAICTAPNADTMMLLCVMLAKVMPVKGPKFKGWGEESEALVEASAGLGSMSMG